jgi:integrase
MKARFRLVRRGLRNATFYCFDTVTLKRVSLKTGDRSEAQRLLHARNEAHIQPALNLHIARAYLSATDPEVRTRTWQQVMEIMATTRKGETLKRWNTAMKDSAFNRIRKISLLETKPEQLLQVLNAGTVSTNVFLRRMHNFAMDMSWLAWPVIPRRQWPVIEFKEKRALTEDEHLKIVAGEQAPEWRAYYELLWNVGGAQSDVAILRAEDVDWDMQVLTFSRSKTEMPVQLHFGETLSAVLKTLPAIGPLFPHVSTMKESDRAKAFSRRCRLVGVSGVSLHSYRYAWAERARTCGYPERFAQEALGHNSKAVHRAYAKKAAVKLPSLEQYENAHEQGKLVPVQFVVNG